MKTEFLQITTLLCLSGCLWYAGRRVVDSMRWKKRMSQERQKMAHMCYGGAIVTLLMPYAILLDGMLYHQVNLMALGMLLTTVGAVSIYMMVGIIAMCQDLWGKNGYFSQLNCQGAT